MNEFTIRPFQVADFEAVAVIWREVFPTSIDLSDSREYIEAFLNRNPGLSFVATVNGRLVAAALSGHDRRRGYVYHLGVLPEFRRHGIGAALLGKVEKALASAGIVKLHLFVRRDHQGADALEFYRRLGYQRRDEIVVCSKMIKPAAPSWTITELRLAEIGPAAAMIERVFDEFVGPGYAAAGIRTFKKFIQPAEFANRSLNGNFVLIAKDGNGIVGVLEMKNYNHVSLLFVAQEHHRKGIAKSLLRQAILQCRAARPEEFEITVNSSPFAVPVYQRLGFIPIAPEQIRDGIRFVPLILNWDAINKL